MAYPSTPHLLLELERRIRQRTGWRVRELAIDVLNDPARAILRGQATTCVARQLAEIVVHDYLPDVAVENAIAVDNAVEVLPGMPMN